MWKLIFSVPVLLLVLLVALLTMAVSPRDAKKALSRKKEIIEPSESPEAREDSEALFETLKVAPAAEGLDDMVYHLKDKRTQKCYYYIDGFKTATFEEVEC